MASVRWWIAATRPKTLVLSFMPTASGIAWAWHDGSFATVPAFLTLACAVLLQVLANYVNELGDYMRGADVPQRLGPPRAVASGAISPGAMRNAALRISLLVLAMGLYLVAHVGWWLLVVGLCALALAWLYTTGPRPLAYVGLGDVAAVLFFGIIPAGGAYAIQHQQLALEPIVGGITFGAFAAAVLSINNVRDRHTDHIAGKHTLVLRIGYRRAIRYIQILLAVPYIIAAVQSISTPLLSVTLASLPMAWSVARDLPSAEGIAYNALLARTTLTCAVYGTLYCGAVIAPL